MRFYADHKELFAEEVRQGFRHLLGGQEFQTRITSQNRRLILTAPPPARPDPAVTADMNRCLTRVAEAMRFEEHLVEELSTGTELSRMNLPRESLTEAMANNHATQAALRPIANHMQSIGTDWLAFEGELPLVS